MFTDQFDQFATESDCIVCTVDGYRILATLYPDDCPDAPDQRQEGFWPSLTPTEAGFIGRGKSIEDWQKAQQHARRIMQSWMHGDWWYGGIVLSVRYRGVRLLDHAASLWGLEVNYPGSDNSHLGGVANELLPDALTAAKRERQRLMALLTEDQPVTSDPHPPSSP